MKRKTIIVTLDEELKNKLSKVCKEKHLIMTRIVEDLIKDWVIKQNSLEEGNENNH